MSSDPCRKYTKKQRSAAAEVCSIRASDDDSCKVFSPLLDALDAVVDASDVDLRDAAYILAVSAFARAIRLRNGEREHLGDRMDAWAEAESMVRTGWDPWG